MRARNVAAFVEAMLRGKPPKPFAPGPDDVDAMRVAIELNRTRWYSVRPRAAFVEELRARIVGQQDESGN